jgi:hypothetical protein
MILTLACVAPMAAAQTDEAALAGVARLTERLSEGVPKPGGRVAVVPVSQATDQVASEIARSMTLQVRNTLAAQHRPDRRIELVGSAEVDRALTELRLPVPVGAAGASLLGGLVGAEYATVSELERRGGHTRLTVHLVELATRRTIRTESVDLNLPATAWPVQAPGGPTLPGGVSSRGFWDGRRAAIASGFAFAGVAAFMAISNDRDLRDAKTRLQEIPPGATDEWNTLREEAADIERTRNFWWGAAAGVGGVTFAYMLVSESRDRAPGRPIPGLRLPGRWRLLVNPLLPAVSLYRAF